LTLLFHQGASTESSVAESFFEVGYLGYCLEYFGVDILAAVKRTAIPHHATFLGWSLNGVDADSEKRALSDRKMNQAETQGIGTSLNLR